MSETFTQAALDYQRIEKAITYVENNFRQQPELSQIAKVVGLSDFHFQRLFKRWVGISPKRFLQFITKEHAKKLLVKADNILQVTYDAGLSSAGRLHDLFVSCDATDSVISLISLIWDAMRIAASRSCENCACWFR